MTMTLTTQDGRTLNLSREYQLNVWTAHSDPQKADSVSITLEGDATPIERRSFFKGKEFTYRGWKHDIKLDEIIGTYPTELRRSKVARMLRAAWQDGATEFTMPQDSQLVLTEREQLEDFAEANHLTLCSINEVGYKPSDLANNLHIWRTTDEFERRNIIICDKYGDYSKSLAKWKALQARATA